MDTAENNGDKQAIEDAEHYIDGMYICNTLYTESSKLKPVNSAPSGPSQRDLCREGRRRRGITHRNQ